MRWPLLFCGLLVIAISGSVSAIAQEVWLRPEKYFYTAGDSAIIQVQLGENFIGAPLILAKNEVELLEWSNKGSTTDLKNIYNRDEKGNLAFRINREGYQLLFLKTTRSSNPDAEKFNEMLRQYGLDEIYNEREKAGLLRNSPTLVNNVFVQLAFRAGRHDAQGWNKPFNLPIEIVPDKNPQTLKRGERIQFTILQDGKPAFGVRVKIWNRWDNRTTIQNIYTEKDGTISTTISSPGDWMVSVIKMKNGSGENEYIADSFNLVFGYR